LRRAAQGLKHMTIVALLYVAIVDDGHVKFERIQ
jgi:hypothetical protein